MPTDKEIAEALGNYYNDLSTTRECTDVLRALFAQPEPERMSSHDLAEVEVFGVELTSVMVDEEDAEFALVAVRCSVEHGRALAPLLFGKIALRVRELRVSGVVK